jgi:hypothetical protein
MSWNWTKFAGYRQYLGTVNLKIMVKKSNTLPIQDMTKTIVWNAACSG